ncbi:MAG: GTPase Era [Bdellovibrionales bacterium]
MGEKLENDFRAGFVAIVGEANAGKSTLLNLLIGEKLAIVSSKPQTTQRRTPGILSSENEQIIFIDPPGYIWKVRSKMNQFLKDEFDEAVKGADAFLWLLSVENVKKDQSSILQELLKTKKPIVLCISKADMAKGSQMAEALDLAQQKYADKVAAITFISSRLTDKKKTQDRLQEQMRTLLRPYMPISPGPLYDPDLSTTHRIRDLCAEFIREQCFLNLKQEIPYGTAVSIRSFEEASEETKNMTRIEADLIVERQSHKQIVIGKSGEMIKTIGSEARKNIQNLIGGKVFLGLHVVVKEGWSTNRHELQELGYVSETR